METTTFGAMDKYYRHSGRFETAGVAKALGLGGVIGVALGAVYAFVGFALIHYVHIGGWVTFAATGGAGFLMGAIISRFLKSGKVRNMRLAMGITFFVAGLMYVSAWETWLYALLRLANSEVGLVDQLTSPAWAFDCILQVNAAGAWSFKGMSPTGIGLALFWLVEAAALFGIPLWLAWGAVHEAPFCENCDKWCASRDLVNLNAGDVAALRAKLEARDFGALTASGKSSASAMHFWHVYFQGCADCDTTQTLCVDDYTLSVDKNGKMHTKKKALIKRLMLSPEDTVAVATAIAGLSVPAPETAPAPEVPPGNH